MDNIQLTMGNPEEKAVFIKKSNSLIQLCRYIGESAGKSPSLLELKLLDYSLSILPNAYAPLDMITFDCRDFWKACGIVPSGSNYFSIVGNALKNLRDRSTWMVKTDPITKKRDLVTVSLVLKAGFSEDGHTCTVVFDPDMIPYLVNIKSNYTKIPRGSVLALQSKYGFTLYELLCSYEYLQKPMRFSCSELAEILDATHIQPMGNFRKLVVEAAVKDINERSQDIHVNYQFERTGRKYTHVTFTLTRLKGNCASKAEGGNKSSLMDDIRVQLKYEELCKEANGTIMPDTFIAAIVYAVLELEKRGDQFAAKYDMDSLSMRNYLSTISKQTALSLIQTFGSEVATAKNQKLHWLKIILNQRDSNTPVISTPSDDTAFQNQIQYGDLIATYPYHKDILALILETAVGVLDNPKSAYSINRASIPGAKVREQFLALTYSDIEAVLYSLENAGSRISGNPTPYLIAMLFNAPSQREKLNPLKNIFSSAKQSERDFDQFEQAAIHRIMNERIFDEDEERAIEQMLKEDL